METEEKEQQQSKVAEALAKVADPRYVLIDAKTGKVESQRWHAYLDCSFVKDQPTEEVETLGERETRLLGLKPCQVCERRSSGGPAVNALKEIIEMVHLHNRASYQMSDEQTAWFITTELKARGFYIGSRTKKRTK